MEYRKVGPVGQADRPLALIHFSLEKNRSVAWRPAGWKAPLLRPMARVTACSPGRPHDHLKLRLPDAFGKTVPRFDAVGRGGFMRRYLTLIFLLCLAIPAGISISGCIRNPAGNYCNGLGYGLKDTDAVFDRPGAEDDGHLPGIRADAPDHRSDGQDLQRRLGDCLHVLLTVRPTTSSSTFRPPGISAPAPGTGTPAAALPTTPSAISPAPLPNSGGLPYATAYITASADSVTSNPVQVYVHAPVSAITLALGSQQACFSQGLGQRSSMPRLVMRATANSMSCARRRL